MAFRVLADLTVVVHFTWILFLVAGGIWGRKHLIIRAIHILGLVLAICLQAMGWYCPLTHLEVWLRRLAEPGSGYAGSFIVHYTEKLVYIEMPGPAISALTLAIFAVNVWLYSRKHLKKRLRRLFHHN